MRKFRNRLMKRIMAMVLSGAMIMSGIPSSGMTVYAAEKGDSDIAFEDDANEAKESEYKELENKEEKPDASEAEKPDAGALKTEGPEEEDSKTEQSKVEKPETEPSSTESSKTETSSTESSKTETSSTESSKTETSSTESSKTETSSEETSSDEESSGAESSEESSSESESEKTLESGCIGDLCDFSNGLKKNQEYADNIVKLWPLDDMSKNPRSAEIEGVNYTFYIAGKNDPKSADNKSISATNLIPATGAAFKIEAVKDAKITFVLNEASTKTYYFVKSDGDLIDSANVLKSDEYTFKMLAGNTYYFCVAGSKAAVFDIKWIERDLEDEANRPDWSTFAKPVVTAAIDDTDKSKINVTVDTIIGSKGADKIEVFMYDENGTEALSSAESVRENEKPTTLAFYPDATGSYKFKAVISRTGETETIESDMSAPVAYKAPLTTPVFKIATSLGGGRVMLKWSAVAETEKYVVEYTDQTAPVESDTSGVIVEGLEIGKKYSFTVYAVRGDEKTAKSKPVECTATQDLEFTWLTANYGNGMKSNGVLYDDKTEGQVNLTTYGVSTSSTGKVVPDSYDGLGFYYTAIDPDLYNFTFTAKAHVNKWTYSNGQEGFGIMAADSVPEVGQSPTAFWNNSYQAVISKIGYRWDGENITTDGTGVGISMLIGAGSTAKTGVTPSDAKAIAVGEATAPARYTAEQTSIDKTYASYGAGSYNLVANSTNLEEMTGKNIRCDETYENFELQIQKNNTGYFVSYTKLKNDGNYALDANGNKITETAKYYDTKALSVLEEDVVYIGVFAARNMDVTFSDINITLTDPKDDLPAEEQPPKYVNLSTNMMSGSIANSNDYTFMFASNWNGQLVIKDSMGNIITRHTEKDENGNEVELDYYNVTGSLDPDKSVLLDGDDNRNTKVYIEKKDILLVGENVFTIEYTPDKNWSPEVDKETGRKLVVLKDDNKATFTHTVLYKKYGEPGETIYVSQLGKASNTGTKASPLDIYTAVQYAQPGQTILLAGGRYSLSSTLQIPRGINGEPDIVDGKETYNKYIKMMAEDPENRPVLDFNGAVAAVVTVGNYWYFKNFDVIRCKNGEKGIQVSGSWCVFDRVDTYKNGSTGLQICRAANTDTYKDWPHDNLILNCNSYLNADAGYEDADGFAAKLTSGSNNVFDGCIAAYNADDGWDLFAKAQTGSIGAVKIINSIAYRNGYVIYDENGNLSERGTLTKAGNGNGFKMGGDGLATGTDRDPDYDPSSNIPNSGHKLYNSLTFYNKSKGIDSNSAPNIKAYNSISYNNGAANINMAPKDWNTQTDYELRNVISLRKDTPGADSIDTRGSQDLDKIDNDTTYKWNDTLNAAVNKSGNRITVDDFLSLEYESLDYIDKSYWRNDDGTINTHGFLQLKEGVTTDPSGNDTPSMGGTPSNDPTVGEDTDGSVTGGSSGPGTEDNSDDFPDDWVATQSQYYGKIWAAEIKYLDNDATQKQEIYYTGKKIEPAVYVHFSSDKARLVKNKDYKLKYSNNVNAGTATVEIIGVNNFKGFKETTTFKILPINIGTDISVSIPRSVAVAEGKDPEKEIKPTWQGKALKKGKEYEIASDPEDANKRLVKGIGGNFTGEKTVTCYTISEDKLMSKAKVTITTPAKELIYTSKPVIPECTVTLNGKELKLNDDYTVECANNIEIGKATLTVIGNETNYFGSKSINFSIKGGSLNSLAKAYYTRGDKKDQELPKQLDAVAFNGNPSSCMIPENSFEVRIGDNVLRHNIDYKIIQSVKKAGTAKLTIRGINNYKGALTYKYTIDAYELTDEKANNGDITLSCSYNLEYNPKGAKYIIGQNFRIELNGNIIGPENYSLTYKNNKAVTSEGGAKASFVVHGKNLLKGTITKEFTISEADMTDNPDFAVTGKNIITNGNALKYADFKKINAAVTHSWDGKARKLAPNRDYLKDDIEYYIDDGDYKFDAAKDKLININQNGEVIEADKFTENGYATIFIRVKADESPNNKSSYKGECVGMVRAAMWDIGKATSINKAPRIFGKNYEKGNGYSAPMVFDTLVAPIGDYIEINYRSKGGNETLQCVDLVGKYTYDFSVYDTSGFAVVPNSYKKNTKVGTASFTVVGTGKYAGTKKVTFKIINKEKAEKDSIW